MAKENLVVKQQRFIQELYEQKQYFNCISGTRKLLVYDHDPKNHPYYLSLINKFYFLGGQYQTVIQKIKQKKEMTFTDKMMLAQSYWQVGNYQQADQSLPSFDNLDQELSLVFKESKNLFAKRKKKSKGMAVFLASLAPGTGHIYAGEPWAGLISFLGVALPAIGSFFLFKKGERSLGCCLAFFSGTFYGGNIYSAYQTVFKKNRLAQKKIWSGLRSLLIDYDPFFKNSKELFPQ